ncbi:nidogen-like domain-containing protein [Cognatishimia sp. F0-27]|uniref:nidogen-like domain-containing protein n=1 Tax=Cognatishimia sp. F0-27 TaxID=2816855 RepID=UPI001D0C3A7E|nr:nidogen-like domain-containing protein [Cognatishimia sp. F0-27]MCC1491459.1 cadherin domain-containing protein [Cognatishimia sp. F0-27]
MTQPLLQDLGGTIGFGEGVLPRNDDGSTGEIELSAVFENGLDFYGTVFDSLWVNNNGNVTFTGPFRTWTPSPIANDTRAGIFPFWSDVLTRSDIVDVTPGGTSQGTNRVYYDLDVENDRFVVTWDDVTAYQGSDTVRNAFQLVIEDASYEVGRTLGDFNIEFRYEAINWTRGDRARAGFSSGNEEFFELPQSGSQSEMLRLEDIPGNTGEEGLWRFEIRSAAWRLPEGTPDLSPVGVVDASDLGLGETIRFAITSGNTDPDGDGTPAFAIDAATGAITVADSDDLDYETTPAFTLDVTVTDEGGLSDTTVTSIALLDLRERIGTDNEDHIQGSQFGDLFLAGAGNDVLRGYEGNDIFYGGPGIDTVKSDSQDAYTLTNTQLIGAGTNILSSIERVQLAGNSRDNTIDASGFTDGTVTLEGRGGNDTLIAPVSGLAAPGRATVNMLSGGAGDDDLTGGAGLDMLFEQADADFTLGAATLAGNGTDSFRGIEMARLTGGAGDNALDVSGFTGLRTFLVGQGGNDRFIGGTAFDRVEATADADFVLTDTQLQGDGVDTLVGIDAARLTGGSGDNTFDVSAATLQSVTLSGLDGDDTFIGRSGFSDMVRERGDVDFTLTDTGLTGRGTDTLVDIDSVHLSGGQSANVFDFSAFTGPSAAAHPNGGDDTVIGRANGFDSVFQWGDADMTVTDTLLSGNGNVTLVDVDQVVLSAEGRGVTFDASGFTVGTVKFVGSQGDDVLRGGSGNDILIGGPGTNQLFGGAGSDLVHSFGDSDMTLTDTELTGLGTDLLDGIERASLTGGVGDNVLDGSAFTGAALTLEGHGGDDMLIGRPGFFDEVRASGDADFAVTDTQLTGLGTDTLVEIDAVVLTGYAGSNLFNASAFTRGPVTVRAQGGDDSLIGGAQADVLDGGTGADSFWFVDPAQGPDRVVFEPGHDEIRLDSAGFDGLPLGALPEDRLLIAPDGPVDDSAVLLYDGGNLSFDADGTGAGAPVLFAILDAAPTLSAADIIVDVFAL